MRPRCLSVGVLGSALLASFASAQDVTLGTLLDEMLDREALARAPDPWYDCRQASSYDRASVNPADLSTWFANGDADKYLRSEQHEGREEWVMMDEAGPGAVVRIWSANPKGTLRVYLDGSETPVIEAPMADLLRSAGEVAGVPLGAPLSAERSRGCNLYLPIPYGRHCLITSDERGFYYQVNYRTYEAGAEVETLTPDVLVGSRSQIEETQRRLVEPFEGMRAPRMTTLSIPADEAREVPLETGARAVREIRVTLPADAPRDTLRSVVLEAEFDGEQTVWCPLGDFFLTGPVLSDVATWTDHVDAGSRTLRSGWVMPYGRSATLRLRNLSGGAVTLQVGAATEPSRWDDRSMHFVARWRQEASIHTRPMHDWNYVEAKGEGVYVGDTLSVVNPVMEWWGEGDEKIYVDGERFPSHFGTGSEDYYGYAWCSPQLFQDPFHAQPRCDGPGNYGHTTVARVRLLDGIPFHESIKTDIEIWHWAECDIAYAATTFLYMKPGGTTNRPELPEEAARGVIDPAPLPPPFRIEGALECEDLKVVGASEGMPVGAQDMQGFGRDKWSGNSQLWCQGRKVGDYVEVRIPVEGDGLVKLKLFATKSWDYGVLGFAVNGKTLERTEDTFSGGRGKVEPTGAIALGTFAPRNGAITLRVTVVGSNPDAEGSGAFFGLDAVVLEPVQGK